MDIAELHKDPEGTLKQLEAKWVQDENDLETNQLLAETHFELGNAEQALGFVTRSVELDPTGEKGGFAKFMWLGQLIGGADGIQWFQKGVNGLMSSSSRLSELERAAVNLRICAALMAMIEIWMTDLCMEPEAEAECEKLIAQGFLLNDEHPELWSVLGSIRISQQRYPEAKEALEKSWALYFDKDDDDALDPMAIGALIRLTQSLLEVRSVEVSLEIIGELHRLDDQIPDVYYLTALAHKMLFQECIARQKETKEARLGDYDFDLEKSKHIVAARDALELLNQLPEDEVDPELADATRAVVDELPEPSVADPFSKDDEDEDAIRMD